MIDVPSITVSSPARKALDFLSAMKQRTPKNRSSIQPSGEEMHPQLHHKTTSTPYGEARWLGFFNMGSQTAPAKVTHTAIAAPNSPTPSKPAAKMLRAASPDFKFTFKRQSSVELSLDAQMMMKESREEAAKIRERFSALPAIPDTEPSAAAEQTETDISDRKIAKPKGKVGRFSAVHMAEFKKMDSIGNHASLWRLNANSSPAVKTSLKRSPSKAELDKADSSVVSKTTATSASVAGSKRMKRAISDDSSTTVATPRATPTPAPNASPSKIGAPRTGLTHLMTPTKSSLARSHSMKSLRTKTVTTTTKLPLPSLGRSKSLRDLKGPHTPSSQRNGPVPKPSSPSPVKFVDVKADSPIKLPIALSGTPEPTEKQPGSAFRKIKSILRTPQRLYSNNPALIAAGTHMATPPELRTRIPLVPATAPVYKVKHVDFSASANEKAKRDELKAVSVEPDTVQYPILPVSTEEDDSRRSTISSLPIPGSFTFRAGSPIRFASTEPSTPRATIRAVRSSDIGLSQVPEELQVNAPKQRIGGPSPFTKRKLEFLGQVYEQHDHQSEKENLEQESEDRPSKKMRKLESFEGGFPCMPSSPQKATTRKLVKKSRLPTSASKRAGGLSAARLDMLATPKRRA